MQIMLRWLNFLFCILIAGCGNDSKTPDPAEESPSPVLSVSAYYYTEPAASSDAEWIQRYIDAFNKAMDAGAKGQFESYRWRDLEPHVGQYDQQKIDSFISAMHNADTHHLTQLVGIQVINTVKREVPAELVNTPWDNPAMINAMKGLLDKIMASMANSVAYVSIGNEVDVYFLAGRQNQMAAYEQFFNSTRAYLHQRLPAVKVGITITANGWLGNQAQALADMSRNSDVMIATYYPLNSDFTVQPPTAPAADFPALLHWAGDKPLVLQEVGYPSSTLSGSSLAQQAEFIHQVFSAWRDSNGRIPLLNLFLLHDFATSLVSELVLYYGDATPAFRAYLDSLGLRNRNNTDKPAWQAVIEEARSL